jgi:hypothetical protein
MNVSDRCYSSTSLFKASLLTGHCQILGLCLSKDSPGSDEYKTLLRKLDLKGVMKFGGNCVFEQSVFGLGLQGTYKGFLYSDVEPRKLEPTLDDVSDGNCDYVARIVEKPWYLYLRDCSSRDERVNHGLLGVDPPASR